MSDKNPLARHGGLSYLEIPASDPARSAAFYALVVGWEIDQRSGDDFRFSAGDGLLIGRWIVDRAVCREAGLQPIIYVEDLDLAVSRVTAGGGEVVKPPYTEGDVLVARVRDPAGNPIGLWQLVR